MLTIRLFARLVLFAGTALFVPSVASPCSCISLGPACQATWTADAVFVGHVERVSTDETSAFATKQVRIKVIEAFRGDVPAEVDVHTGAGGGDCGFGFVEGGTYLVYGTRSTAGRLSTSICQRTRNLNEAAAQEDLTYLRQMATLPEDSSSILGDVRQESSGFTRGRDVPVAGIQVTAQSGDAKYQTQSGADGRYRLDVPPGRYRFSVDIPEGLYNSNTSRELEVRGRACVESRVFLRSDGRIVGRVLDSSGRPVPYFTVHVIETNPRGISSVTAVTNQEGLYEISELPEGTYHVAAGGHGGAGQPRATRVLHPGVTDTAKTTNVIVGFGQRQVISDIKLPADMSLVTITGIVRDATGAGVPGVKVYVFDDVPAARPGQLSPMIFAVEPAVTDATGRYRLTTDAGRYRMTAELRGWQPEHRLRQQELGAMEIEVSGRVDFTLPD